LHRCVCITVRSARPSTRHRSGSMGTGNARTHQLSSTPRRPVAARYGIHADWSTLPSAHREDNTGLSVISFRSQQLRQVGCYTVLSGFQPSWPPTCYHQQLTSFCGFLDEPASQAPQPCTRFTPRRQYCLPVMAHMEPHHSPVRTSTSTHPLASERTPAQCPWTLPSHNAPLARPPWGSGISRARLQFDDRSKGRGPPKSLSCIARHHKTRSSSRACPLHARLQLS